MSTSLVRTVGVYILPNEEQYPLFNLVPKGLWVFSKMAILLKYPQDPVSDVALFFENSLKTCLELRLREECLFP